MPSLAQRMRQAADTIEEYAAYTGNRHPDNVAYTAADIRHESGHVAAEQMTSAHCPMCGVNVWCNNNGAIGLHRDSIGNRCTTSGQPFTIAVVTE
jgi:hypothetical protein